MNHSVTVPAHVLQDLLFNAGLLSAGQGDMELVAGAQIRQLQDCIDEQVGDADTVYGREPGTSPADGVELEMIGFDDPRVVSLFGANT